MLRKLEKERDESQKQFSSYRYRNIII